MTSRAAAREERHVTRIIDRGLVFALLVLVGCGGSSGDPVPVTPDGGSSGFAVGLAVGSRHACAVFEDGSMKCWGENDEGQLGNGMIAYFGQPTPVAVQGLDARAVAASAGKSHTCALLDDGGVACWGNSTYGQLGRPSGVPSNPRMASRVGGLPGPAAQVVSGDEHSCARLVSGAVYCWGRNLESQIGNEDVTSSTVETPTQPTGLSSGVVALAAGGGHTCAVMSDGSMLCWGDNSDRETGVDSIFSEVPTPAPVVGLGAKAIGVGAGVSHTCAILEGGALACFGSNRYGQAGIGSLVFQQATPAAVVGLGAGVIKMAGGDRHSCAIAAGGALKCFGADDEGQVGNGDLPGNVGEPSDVQGLGSGVVDVGAGIDHSCALLATGVVRCFGSNYYTQLARDPTILVRTSPTAVQGLTTGVTLLEAGNIHTCAQASGIISCWGNNYGLQLGVGGLLGFNDDGARGVPQAMTTQVTDVVELSMGGTFGCARTSSGGAVCWGSNAQSELGVTGSFDHVSPTEPSGLSTGVLQIAAGGSFACARLAAATDSSVSCWGRNSSGQAGQYDMTTPRVAPGPVGGLGSGVVGLAAGDSHACVIMAASGVRCWGENDTGQLGDGDTTDSYLPVDVPNTADAASLAIGGSHSCLLSTAGEVRCWGSGSSGQIGDGLSLPSFAPLVAPLPSAAVQIVAGTAHTCARLDDSRVFCWGNNVLGQVGDGTTENRASPVEITALGTATSALTAGAFHTCARLADGSARCWGSDESGQLGDDGIWGRGTTPWPIDVVFP